MFGVFLIVVGILGFGGFVVTKFFKITLYYVCESHNLKKSKRLDSLPATSQLTHTPPPTQPLPTTLLASYLSPTHHPTLLAFYLPPAAGAGVGIGMGWGGGGKFQPERVRWWVGGWVGGG